MDTTATIAAKAEGKGVEPAAFTTAAPAEQAYNVSGKPRCKELNKQGEPCRSTSVGSDGLCAAHSGKTQFGTAETSRKGAEASVQARKEKAAAREARAEEASMSLTELLKLRALERREELVKALLDAAAQGRDVPALRMVWDRLDGKVADKLELEAAQPQSLEDIRAMSPEQRLAFIRQRTVERERRSS
jgi:hypothetical protein